MTTSNFEDVAIFLRYFRMDQEEFTPEKLEMRRRFMQEELDEFIEAESQEDRAGMADALIDLVYVAMGTAFLMGLPWEELWAEVHTANMLKIRATRADESKRGTAFDAVKPQGWEPPDIEGVLARHDAALARIHALAGRPIRPIRGGGYSV